MSELLDAVKELRAHLDREPMQMGELLFLGELLARIDKAIEAEEKVSAPTDNQPKPPPTKPGLYLAKTMGCQWFNLIVDVYGTAPFLKATAYNRIVETVTKHFDISQVTEWSDALEQGG